MADDGRVSNGYDPNMSPALCVVVYDLSGAPLDPATVDKVTRAVESATEADKLAITVTRT